MRGLPSLSFEESQVSTSYHFWLHPPWFGSSLNLVMDWLLPLMRPAESTLDKLLHVLSSYSSGIKRHFCLDLHLSWRVQVSLQYLSHCPISSSSLTFVFLSVRGQPLKLKQISLRCQYLSFLCRNLTMQIASVLARVPHPHLRPKNFCHFYCFLRQLKGFMYVHNGGLVSSVLDFFLFCYDSFLFP